MSSQVISTVFFDEFPKTFFSGLINSAICRAGVSYCIVMFDPVVFAGSMLYLNCPANVSVPSLRFPGRSGSSLYSMRGWYACMTGLVVSVMSFVSRLLVRSSGVTTLSEPCFVLWSSSSALL